MKDKHYRLIVTYSGFDEKKDEKVIRAAGKDPSQLMYDPVESRRSLDFTFGTTAAARSSRARIVVLQQSRGSGSGFSVSRVIDDTF